MKNGIRKERRRIRGLLATLAANYLLVETRKTRRCIVTYEVLMAVDSSGWYSAGKTLCDLVGGY
jgi:hypothetical protein